MKKKIKVAFYAVAMAVMLGLMVFTVSMMIKDAHVTDGCRIISTTDYPGPNDPVIYINH